MLTKELGGPVPCVEVKIHRQQPATHGLDGVTAPRHPIHYHEPRDGLCNLIDKRVQKNPTQESGTFQTIQPEKHSPGRIGEAHSLCLIDRAIAAEVGQSFQEFVCSFVQHRRAVAKSNTHPCPHSKNAVVVDRYENEIL
jgi:hypothetical protein